ncbi:excitatory amino acid transporter-like [Gigantopelta aegis]|uniref:excitatory amino acid transporter-like n=1 Tax=Gigantopelta aegis TaxID=1735272 RepID=UPI001B888679|nr:excitatory amino acid transporter-like [Gigantopelta aegis]
MVDRKARCPRSGCDNDNTWCCNIPWKSAIRNNLIVLLTIGGVVVGFIVGFLVKTLQPSQDAIIWIGIPGEVYMRMLKMMILPLIICSVITGTSSLDPKCNGKVSMVALLYIIVTNAIPCFIGVSTGLIFNSGKGVDIRNKFETSIPTEIMETQDIFADLIRNLFLDNLITACFQQAQTKYHTKDRIIEVNDTGKIVNQTVGSVIKSVGTASSTNILGLVLCSMVFGIAATAVGDTGKPFIAFFHSATEIIMKILRWFVWFTPVGVASLIAVALLEAGHMQGAFRSLGMFSVSVFTGLAVHQLLVVPLLFFVLTRTNPYTFLLTLGRPVMVTFAAASSAIAIPETLNILENKNNVDRRISRFVVPFAATINRDGSALYIATACIFIAQLSDVQLDGGKVVLICVLTTVISVAIPSVPSAGVVAVLINLTALNIPADSIGLLFALEWIIDRVRSSVNMIGHAFCTMITYKLCIKSMLEAYSNDTAEIEILVQAPSDPKDKPYLSDISPPPSETKSNSMSVPDVSNVDSNV